jgi:hypothetical protein
VKKKPALTSVRRVFLLACREAAGRAGQSLVFKTVAPSEILVHNVKRVLCLIEELGRAAKESRPQGGSVERERRQANILSLQIAKTFANTEEKVHEQ